MSNEVDHVGTSHQATADAIFAWWPEVRGQRDTYAWRQTREPWLTLMAEMMLGQTQVDRVAERFGEMIERFPTPAACARSTQAEVVALWVGLGYNRRAVALHRCATIIDARYDGLVPNQLDALLELPGIGPYTARAILAFAFDEPVGVVDTNIGRVLARAFHGSSLRPAAVQTLADELVSNRRAREWNLAVMDFGNLVCRSRSPHCDSCVLGRSLCAWRRNISATGEAVPDPAVGSGGVTTRQSTFIGSDRQGRGRLVKAACDGPIRASQLASTSGWPDDPERAQRVADGLVRDGVLMKAATGNYQLA